MQIRSAHLRIKTLSMQNSAETSDKGAAFNRNAVRNRLSVTLTHKRDVSHVHSERSK